MGHIYHGEGHRFDEKKKKMMGGSGYKGKWGNGETKKHETGMSRQGEAGKGQDAFVT